MARFGVQVPEIYEDGGEATGESSVDARAEVDAGISADQTAAHHGGATTSSSCWNLRGRNVPKVGPATKADSDQEDVLRIVSSRSLVFQGGASVEEGEQQGIADEEDSLKYNVKKLNGTVETLQRVVQVQTSEVGDLKSLVLTQSRQIESQSKQIETLLATVDDLKELVSHRSSGSQHEEPVVGYAAGNREEGLSVTNASGASGDQQNSITICKVETETATSPPDYQEDDSITSVKFWVGPSPIGTTLVEAAVHNNSEQLVENWRRETSADSNASDDARPPSSFPSDQRQVESLVHASDDSAESRKLVQKPRTRECYVSLQRIKPVLRSSAAAGGLSVPAASTIQDEKNSSSAEDSDGSHEEEKMLKRRTYNYDHIIEVDTKPTLYQCEVCRRKFRSKAWRRQHEVCKNGLKNVLYKCKECSLGFSKKSHYDRHMMGRHSNERRFPCPQCPLRFKEKYNVTQHVKEVHLRKKTIRCPHCPTTFAHPSNLKVHVRIHTGERPYLCEKCSRTFKDTSALAAHMRRAHPSESV